MRSPSEPGFLSAPSGIHTVSSRETARPFALEEELVPDDRGDTRPAQMVENKLSHLLRDEAMMISQIRLRNLLANRN